MAVIFAPMFNWEATTFMASKFGTSWATECTPVEGIKPNRVVNSVLNSG